MTDTFDPEQRSAIMRAVKGKNTSLEIRLRSVLWRMGLRYRVNVSRLPGKPDIVFTRKKVVVFVDSCFFHGCPQHLRRPKSNDAYWRKKIDGNIQRDIAVNQDYKKLGWTIVRIWEHELKSDLRGCALRIASLLKGLPLG